MNQKAFCLLCCINVSQTLFAPGCFVHFEHHGYIENFFFPSSDFKGIYKPILSKSIKSLYATFESLAF